MVYCAGKLIENFKLFYKSVSQSAQAHITSLIHGCHAFYT